MKTRTSLFVTASLSGMMACTGAADASPEPMIVWFSKPASSFHESCVLGNGRLGAMDLGGVDRQCVVLNESSVWSGGPYDGNKYDAYQCLPEVREKLFAGDIRGSNEVLTRSFRYADGIKGWGDDAQFGCYQILGDLTLVSGGEAMPTGVMSPSGHSQGDGKTIAGSVDGNPKTKWCTPCNSPVVWQVNLPAARRVESYSLTSADDVPQRDPLAWILEGSTDGRAWTALDKQTLDKPFEQRFQTKQFTIAQPGEYRCYRFTFTPRISYFQVAEIALAGVQAKVMEEAVAEGYRRELDLMTGLARTSFTKEGVIYSREMVASKPDEVIAMRLKADKPGALSFVASLSRRQNATARADGDFQRLDVQLPFNKPGVGLVNGRRCLALLGAKSTGGRVTARDDGLHVSGADEVVLMVSAGTDLFDAGFEAKARQRLVDALGKSFDGVRDRATADHGSFMNRCRLQLPAGPNAALPTPERVKLNEKEPDPALAALYFQFGRHLMVSGSRPDSQLPANLQGIWAEEYSTPWRGDFHSNINLQMNYWPAEVTNLADCHEPLLRFLKGVAREGAKTAKAYFNAPGWMANHTQNPWFDTSPSYLPACAGPTCGAWLAQHLWTHYEFTRDKEFLREYYPVLRGAAEFCFAALVEEPRQKWLVTVPSNSPENSYFFTDKDGKKGSTAYCAGATFDMQIVRGLFVATAQAARTLGTDAEFAAKLDAARVRLAPTRVNAEGRIKEWLEDLEEREVHHRHCSHLWGLYPGTEINPNTPELYEGARRSLERRGDASTGWSMAWKANFWARLRDGDRSGKLVSMLVGRGYGNLMCACPPFQIDGNFGGCAAVAEMLIQSHDGSITLLPALPAAWSEGKVTGLCARGNCTVDIEWKHSKVTHYRISSPEPDEVKVRFNGELQTTRSM